MALSPQAAEASVDEDTRAELPVPSMAVTEEDAQREAGAEPEAAAAGEVKFGKLVSVILPYKIIVTARASAHGALLHVAPTLTELNYSSELDHVC